MSVDIARVKELFAAALELSGEARTAYLDTVCADDGELRRRLEAMLRTHEDSGELLSRSPAEILADTDDATQAEAMAAAQPPASRTQAEDGGCAADSLDFLEPSATPGHLGRLGHYAIHEVIGKGGFGVVLKAFDERLHRIVAIKVLAPAFANNGAARQRFIREARTAAAVKNEHVVGIYDVEDPPLPPLGKGGPGGVPYLAMEMIDGVSLQDKIDKQGSLGVKEILRIGMQMAEGLAAAHKQGLVHRDIKPANILLENGVERVKITDFGLARAVDDASVTQSGTVAGTPMYMSPEQAEGLPIDHRSDLFSLGTVLYAMCTGHPPFRASGTHAVLKRVIDAVPRPIREVNNEVPHWLCDIIARLHAKKPEDRFQTAKEVAELLGERLADVQAGRQAYRARSASEGVAGAEALQSPGEASRSHESDAELAKLQRALRGPAIGLTATGLLNWLAFFAIVIVWGLVPEARPPAAVIVAVLVIVPMGSTPLLWGAATLYHRGSRRWGMAPALIALCVGPGYVIGWPVGIWTLAVVRRRDLSAAFGADRGMVPAADNAAWSVPRPDSPGRHIVLVAALLLFACGPGLIFIFWLQPRVSSSDNGTFEATWIDPTLVVTLSPKDGAPIFLKRNVAISVAPGEYSFRALKEDEGVFGRRIQIEAGKTQKMTVIERGTLAFETTDPTLKVKVDRLPWPSIQDKGKHVFAQALPVGWHVCQVVDAAGKVVWEDKKGVGGEITEIIDIEKMRRLAAEANDPGWVQLFNGKDLKGWTAHREYPGFWKVDDGAIVGAGPVDYAFLGTVRDDFE